MLSQDIRVAHQFLDQVEDQTTTTTTTTTVATVSTTITTTATSTTTTVPITTVATTTAVPASSVTIAVAISAPIITTTTTAQQANKMPTAEEVHQQRLRERMLAIRAGFDKQLLALSLNKQNMSSTSVMATPPTLARLASTPSAEEGVIPPKIICARRSITLNTAEPVSSIKCSICLESCCTRAKNICPQKCESANMCLKCARQYWHTEIMARRFFIAPLHCPGCHLPVPVKDWRKLAGESMFATFRQYMSSIFYIRCSGCEQDACFLQYSGDDNNQMSKESRMSILEDQLRNHERRNRAAISLICKEIDNNDQSLAKLFVRLLTDQLGAVAARRIVVRQVPNIDFEDLVSPVANQDAKKVHEQNEQMRNALEAFNSNLTMETELQYGRDMILAALDSLNAYVSDSAKRFCQAVVDVFGKKSARKLLIRKAVRHDDVDDENEREENSDPDGELLLLIEDEERRAQVQHVFMKQFERKVATDCCYTPVCFNCKFYDWHEELTCEQIIKQTIDDMPVYVEEVVFLCPSCFVQIVHAGGCSSVRCVCGHDFCLEDLGYSPGSAETWDWTGQATVATTATTTAPTTTTATTAGDTQPSAATTTTTATDATITGDVQQSVVLTASTTTTTDATTVGDVQQPVVLTASTTTTTDAITVGDVQQPDVLTVETTTTSTTAGTTWADQHTSNDAAISSNWEYPSDSNNTLSWDDEPASSAVGAIWTW